MADNKKVLADLKEAMQVAVVEPMNARRQARHEADNAFLETCADARTAHSATFEDLRSTVD